MSPARRRQAARLLRIGLPGAVAVLVLAVTAHGFLDLRGRLFLGFFGVRGVAALYYATIVAATGDLSHTNATKILWTTIVCVAISITLHGITATPLTRRLLT